MGDEGTAIVNGRLPFWLISAMFTILSTVVGVTGKAVIDNDRRSIDRHIEMMDNIAIIEARLAAIEGNRWTSRDAALQTQAIMKELPPKWLVDRVEKNERRLDLLDRNGRTNSN